MKRNEDWIFVRNNSDQDFSDRYDGEDFSISAGEYDEMPAAAAKLIFGFGEEDKTRAIRRLGWGTTHGGAREGMERLKKFSFHMTEAEAKSGSRSEKNSAIPLPGDEEDGNVGHPSVPSNASRHTSTQPGKTNLLARAASQPAA